MITFERIRNIATVLGLTPTKRTKITKNNFSLGDEIYLTWWIVGCKEGDQPLPMTGGAKTKEEALQYVEEWFGIK